MKRLFAVAAVAFHLAPFEAISTPRGRAARRPPRLMHNDPSRFASARYARAMIRRTWLFSPWLIALAMLAGCKGEASSLPDDPYTRRDNKIVLEECDVESDTVEALDANGDGRPDVVRVLDGEREVCRTVELNMDGRVDRTTFLDENGKPRRLESDFDKDGIVDEISFFEAGVVTERHRATTLDGKLDTWEFYDRGHLVGTERDENGDGIIDQWWEYPSNGCPLIHADADGDGRPDPGATIDYCKETGYVPPQPVAQSAKKGSGFESTAGEGAVQEVGNRGADEAPEATEESSDE